jgi:hypothetical protein
LLRSEISQGTNKNDCVYTVLSSRSFVQGRAIESMAVISTVKLRNHPLVRHPDGENWPPVWTRKTIDGVKAVSGEVGVLIYVYAGSGWDKCYLVVEDGNEHYTGTLLFSDVKLCRQVTGLLRDHIGRSIHEIGDLDVRVT